MPEALEFLRAVDWRKLKLPLYPNLIKNPVDLGIISGKLARLEYGDIFEFNKEMELVWSNAKEFNKPGSSKSIAAEYLARTWRQKFASIRNDTMETRLWRGKDISVETQKI